MRSLSIILALCGSVWVPVGLAGWIVTIAYLPDVKTLLDCAKLFILIVILTSGFFVWWGWLFYSFKERYPWVSMRDFWVIGLFHHILLIAYLLPDDVWGGGDDPWWIPLWIIGNMIVAIVVIASRPWIKINAEQD